MDYTLYCIFNLYYMLSLQTSENKLETIKGAFHWDDPKRIGDLRSLRSWCIKVTGESTLSKDSPVPLMHRDLSDLGSLILFRIIPMERTLNN